jgi:hypothetical protein
VSAVVLLLFLITVVGVETAMRGRGRSGALDTSGEWPQPLGRRARTTARWRLAGLGVGIGVGIVAAQLDVLGRGLMLAVPLCALCVLVGVVIGELRITAPRGPVRSAGLEVRRIRDYLPRRLTRVVAAATVLLVLVLGMTTAAGSPDDLGRAGRTLARQCSALVGTAVGPWPGSFYTAPLATVVLAGLVLAGVALRRVVHRPRSGEDPSADDALRRQAAESVVAGVGLLVAVPLAGVSFFAAQALSNVDCAPVSWRVAAGALGLLVPALAVLAAWCIAALTSPTEGRVPRSTCPAAR